MSEDTGVKGGVKRRAYKLNETYEILGLSDSQGASLVRQKKIRVVRLGLRSPRVTEEEINRILRDGIQ
jgi:hypothetical protein